ncbi:hypothetical protein TNCV_4449621 [Trichonephila clavipes]|nr:hypothetical protein TNCV_4449621 [Trichonephila clavipes]
MWSMVAQRLTQITPPATTPDQLSQRVEAAWSAVPQEHIQSLYESMPRRVAVEIAIVLEHQDRQSQLHLVLRKRKAHTLSVEIWHKKHSIRVSLRDSSTS